MSVILTLKLDVMMESGQIGVNVTWKIGYPQSAAST